MLKTVGTFSILSTKVYSGIIYNGNFGDNLHNETLCFCHMIDWIADKKFVLDLDKRQTIELKLRKEKK